nr:methionine adenosyltransferase domain-containing protein [Halomonas sp. THAF5a]
MRTLERSMHKAFDFSIAGILNDLSLQFQPYYDTVAYGHFGRDDIRSPWKEMPQIRQLQDAARVARRTPPDQQRLPQMVLGARQLDGLSDAMDEWWQPVKDDRPTTDGGGPALPREASMLHADIISKDDDRHRVMAMADGLQSVIPCMSLGLNLEMRERCMAYHLLLGWSTDLSTWMLWAVDAHGPHWSAKAGPPGLLAAPL